MTHVYKFPIAKCNSQHPTKALPQITAKRLRTNGVKAALSPLIRANILWTDSDSTHSCPEQHDVLNFTKS